MNSELVLIYDFGGQTAKLIARRVREQHVYCEVVPFDITLAELKTKNPQAIIFSGGPNSIYADGAPRIDLGVFDLELPILGICYGMQLITHEFGGEVARSDKREYGMAALEIDVADDFLCDINDGSMLWMSHGDSIKKLGEGYVSLAHTANTPFTIMKHESKPVYGVQFHPEVDHTEQGRELLSNFLFNVAGLKGDWRMDAFIETQIAKIREQVGDKKVVCGLSGGVDSSVAAVIVHQAIGNQLTCIFVNHGLLRQGEAEQVIETFDRNFGINLVYADEQDRFMDKLAGVEDPEHKRKIIGEEFIRVFEDESNKLGQVDFLVQGTIYPDVIESGTKTAAVIKSHHNVGVAYLTTFSLV